MQLFANGENKWLISERNQRKWIESKAVSIETKRKCHNI